MDRNASYQDLAAERAVLGAILMDNAAFANVLELIAIDDFAQRAHGEIFGAMTAIDSRSDRIDHVTLAEELRVLGNLASVGGPSYLAQLDQTVPFAQNAVDYARIIKNQSIRRALARAGREISQLASQETGEIATLLDEAERRVFSISERRHSGDLRAMPELVEDTMRFLDRIRTAHSGITGLATGFIDLDRLLTGFHRGELLILAARPGVGKTALGLNIALNVARGVSSSEPGKAVGIFSLEMPSALLVSRLLGSHASVNMSRIRAGKMSEQEFSKLFESASELSRLPIHIDDSGGLSSFDLRAKARRLKQREPNLGLIVIDYLQLMHQTGRIESRQLEVSEISRSLKLLAKELNIPILTLSQLNRRVDERKEGRPLLSDLRESGAIEQDADVVMFIHPSGDSQGDDRPHAPQDPAMPRDCDLIVAKQRNGPVGTLGLRFLPDFTSFGSRGADH